MNFADLVNKNLDQLVDEKEGFKLYPNAKFPFTKERAEEFSKVGLEQLIDDPYFLNQKWNGQQGVWPRIKDTLLEFEATRKAKLLNTFLFTGSIGIGKSSVSNILLYWQLFEIIIIPKMNEYYGMMEGKLTAFCILSKDADAAKRVTFIDLIPVISTSPFIRDFWPPQVDLDKIGNNPRTMPRELRFPKNIVIYPGSGQAASALGYNIYGACFTGETKIKLANGKSESLFNLVGKRDIEIKGYNLKTRKFVNTVAKEVRLTKKNKSVYTVIFNDGFTCKATLNQAFLTPDGYKNLTEIYNSHSFVGLGGSKRIGYIHYQEENDVYDVINSETENFILENGVVAHNSMDEVNDMAWVESSTKARMKQYYSAAEESYREITERMNSRFPWETLHRQGKKHGFITCIGQSRFPDSFTEKKILEAQILGSESTVYWVKAARWDMQPRERFSRETFLIDRTNKRVIDFLSTDRYPELVTQTCPYCGTFLSKGAYIGNNGTLVCSIDCYKETYYKKIDVDKEKA